MPNSAISIFTSAREYIEQKILFLQEVIQGSDKSKAAKSENPGKKCSPEAAPSAAPAATPQMSEYTRQTSQIRIVESGKSRQ